MTDKLMKLLMPEPKDTIEMLRKFPEMLNSKTEKEWIEDHIKYLKKCLEPIPLHKFTGNSFTWDTNK